MPVTFEDPDAMFLAKDYAEYRHSTENALRQERWRGDGPRYVKLGRRVLYRAGDIAAYIATRTVTPGQAAAHTQNRGTRDKSETPRRGTRALLPTDPGLPTDQSRETENVYRAAYRRPGR